MNQFGPLGSRPTRETTTRTTLTFGKETKPQSRQKSTPPAVRRRPPVPETDTRAAAVSPPRQQPSAGRTCGHTTAAPAVEGHRRPELPRGASRHRRPTPPDQPFRITSCSPLAAPIRSLPTATPSTFRAAHNEVIAAAIARSPGSMETPETFGPATRRSRAGPFATSRPTTSTSPPMRRRRHHPHSTNG